MYNNICTTLQQDFYATYSQIGIMLVNKKQLTFQNFNVSLQALTASLTNSKYANKRSINKQIYLQTMCMA